ncbi:MAG: hypothetical protein JWP36_1909, partial [Paucimonas sp.]|nr:hypothetical protein [Paucimonas sp.]
MKKASHASIQGRRLLLGMAGLAAGFALLPAMPALAQELAEVKVGTN